MVSMLVFRVSEVCDIALSSWEPLPAFNPIDRVFVPIDVQVSESYIDVLMDLFVVKHERPSGLLPQSEKYGHVRSVSMEHEVISIFQIIQADLAELSVVLFKKPLFKDHENVNTH